MRISQKWRNKRIFGTKPFWKPTALLSDIPHEQLETLSDAMQWVSFYDIPGFQRNLFSFVKRGFKSGTTVLKYPWVRDSRWLRRGEESREMASEHLDFRCVPFDDFWVFPLTINCLEEAQVKFQRIRLTKEQVDSRIQDGWWDKASGEALLLGGEAKVGTEPAREA